MRSIESRRTTILLPLRTSASFGRTRPQPVRKFALVRWGLIPYWAKDPSIGQTMINARSETILDKPAFRETFLDTCDCGSGRQVLTL